MGDLSSPDAIDKAFPGVEFLLAFWNMPLVRSESAVPETFSGYDRIWDQDRGGKILKSFLQWLKRKLPENGMAVAWNGAVGKAYNLLMESMKASGLKRKEFLKGEESDVTQATFGVFFLSQAVESAATVAVKADVDSTRAGETSL